MDSIAKIEKKSRKGHKEAQKSGNLAIPLCVLTSIIIFQDRAATINHYINYLSTTLMTDSSVLVLQ